MYPPFCLISFLVYLPDFRAFLFPFFMLIPCCCCPFHSLSSSVLSCSIPYSLFCYFFGRFLYCFLCITCFLYSRLFFPLLPYFLYCSGGLFLVTFLFIFFASFMFPLPACMFYSLSFVIVAFSSFCYHFFSLLPVVVVTGFVRWVVIFHSRFRLLSLLPYLSPFCFPLCCFLYLVFLLIVIIMFLSLVSAILFSPYLESVLLSFMLLVRLIAPGFLSSFILFFFSFYFVFLLCH